MSRRKHFHLFCMKLRDLLRSRERREREADGGAAADWRISRLAPRRSNNREESRRGKEREALEWTTARHFCTIIEINEGKEGGNKESGGKGRIQSRADIRQRNRQNIVPQRATLKTNEGTIHTFYRFRSTFAFVIGSSRKEHLENHKLSVHDKEPCL